METLRHDLRRIVSQHMREDPAHDISHLDRVSDNCENIAISEGGTLSKCLLAAAYLHDLVNLPKNDANRASASKHSAQAAGPLLTKLGFEPEEIARTQHSIAAHSFSTSVTPETLEARILRDADRLDALGAIGIARCLLVSGNLNRALYDPNDPFAENRLCNDQLFSMDHWPVKLLRLPDDMLTNTGKMMARKRVTVMLRFAHELAGELGTELPTDWNATT
ncbi:HD domain-containing protein [Pseudopelagicola sp. nBUS_20]|uniref:HD domain-containing protein n=1 Tax=Pseudopelagicola sp. nBUS_20 TaxID=3395317 RepID=UPI003EBE636C